MTLYPSRNHVSLSYFTFLSIDDVEGRFFDEVDIYWLLVREYGYVLVNTAEIRDLIEMYIMLVKERSSVIYREMYLASKPQESYIEYLNKILRVKSTVISDFEKSEITEVFGEVE